MRLPPTARQSARSGSGDHGGSFHRKGGVVAFREMVRMALRTLESSDYRRRAQAGSRRLSSGVIMLAREIRQADHAVCHGHQPYIRFKTGTPHHQFAILARAV